MAPKRQDSGRDSLAALITHPHLLGGTASRAALTERLGCGRSVMGFLLAELTTGRHHRRPGDPPKRRV
ncbi:hypothetical protein VMT65_14380 [Nocardia sp. CDC153]|uniref:hypothetical protein n=1 Tax=Nocardia sp. CDC153 TaxID=3112167 RepID=UPI002DB73474|nr:hypothetical protein [Nocardia sp. CDC153]MEC3954222.1 hypothetical protein [Nocardia sp. CDC153]